MKKNKKRILIISIIVFLFAIITTIVTYRILNDENKLTVEEKEWITENINVLQNVHILNNVDVFGKNGKGVFYDFINDLKEEYGLKINLITYNNGENFNGRTFKIVKDPAENDIVFYKEHYVIISKQKTSYNDISQISNKKIGVLTTDEQLLKSFFNSANVNTLVAYESSTNLFEALKNQEQIDYAIIPLEENLTSFLTSNYQIVFHISDINKYFVFEREEDDTFSSIIKKYFYKWQSTNLNNSINDNELSTFVQALSISDKDITAIQAKVYNYGFINNSPYEILTGGQYGGIVGEYISNFAKFSKTEFVFNRYKNFNKFTEAIANQKIDIFYNYYNLNTSYKEIDSLNNISFVAVAPTKNPIVINSLTSLNDQEIYVLKNSLIEKYLNTIGGLNLKTYDSQKELKRLASKNKIIVLDKENFNYLNNNILSSYSIRYENTLASTYNFYTKDEGTFNILLNKYLQTLDPQEIKIKGTYNHDVTQKEGTILGKIAKYSLILIALFLLILYFAYRSGKKIKITKKIKKEDKLKYIDQLTSLKNRNYLNDNIANWNKNTIYPQATIIIDLNQVQKINDTLGYEEGDNQIKTAANVLIKTQLDNTDIMRTDGNEYLIYLVGYQEKQIISYIRKLYKEFKNLPYEHGAAIGYSMITDDMKTIEDSINESVENMKKNKEETEEE